MSVSRKTDAPAGEYMYRNRRYRLSHIVVTEMAKPAGGWVTMPDHLTEQLIDHVESGSATRITE